MSSYNNGMLDTREQRMLQAIAGAIAQKPIKVRVSETISTAYYNAEDGIIGINAMVPFEAARGFLVHELLHEKFTIPSDWAKVTDLAPYHNIVEDMRINLGWAKRVFVTASDWIYDCWRHLTTKEGGRWDPQSPSMSLLYSVHGQPTATKAWDDDVQAFSQTYMPTILAANSIANLRPVLEALKALDAKYKADPKPNKDPGEEPKPPQGKQYKTAAGAAKAAAAYTKAKAEYDAKKAAGEAAGDTPFHDRHDPIVRDPAEPVVDGESSGKSSKTGMLQESDAPYNSPVGDRFIANLRSWRNRVAEALMAIDTMAPRRNLARGRLDGTRLHHIAAKTSDRVFVKPMNTRRGVNTAVDILLDISGSTCGECAENLGASAYAVAEACSRVPGVQLGMLQFGHRVHRLIPITHNRMVRLEQAQTSCHDNDTETDLAITQSVADLKAVQVDRRIAIVCTDGALPADETLAFAKGMDVEVYELHICNRELDDEPEHNRCYCQPTNIHQGLDRLIRTLQIRGA